MTLILEDLTVTYGPVKACTNISFQAPPGRVTTVVGANGAGKSTLLRACAGLVTPQSGRILVGSTDLTELPAEERIRHGLAFVPEGRATIPELTVTENMMLGGLTTDRAFAARRSAELFDMFPSLAKRRTQRADVLSGGERQQLAIARALMSQPKALLLDEPSLGLAPLVVTQILDLVAQLSREMSMAILLVEQNAARALKIADQAFVLSLGEIVASGPASTLANDERLLHAYLTVA